MPWSCILNACWKPWEFWHFWYFYPAWIWHSWAVETIRPIYNKDCSPSFQRAPNHVDSTASRLLSEVKQHRVELVLRWGTTLESSMCSFCILFPYYSIFLVLRGLVGILDVLLFEIIYNLQLVLQERIDQKKFDTSNSLLVKAAFSPSLVLGDNVLLNHHNSDNNKGGGNHHNS